jgi:hypothetical protein
LLKDEFELMVVEHSFVAWKFVVQRNRIINLVGNDRFKSLGENKTQEFKDMVEYFQSRRYIHGGVSRNVHEQRT